jgi:hypothetical protein
MHPPTKLKVFASFLTQNNFMNLYHPPPPPNSQDLSMPDYFLFPRLNMRLKRLHFAEPAEIQAITDELKKAKCGIFGSFLQTVRSCKNLYIYANGAYSEFKKKSFLPRVLKKNQS